MGCHKTHTSVKNLLKHTEFQVHYNMYHVLILIQDSLMMV